jgi:hypothetical protein
MKSFLIDRYTKGGALRLGESPEPELRDNDVMVEIRSDAWGPIGASGICHLQPYRGIDSIAVQGGAAMSDLMLLSQAQMRRIKPYFPLSRGIPRVDDR